MDGGDDFATARLRVRQARPDLTARENQLYGYIRAMGKTAVEIDAIARQIQASGASKSAVERFRRHWGLSEIAPGRGYERSEGMQVDNEWNEVQVEIDRRTRQMMATDRRLGYGDAFMAVMAADPALAARRWAAVQLQITDRVKQLMAANSQLTYASALTGVLVQNSKLATEYRLARMGSPPTGAEPTGDPVGVEISALVTEKLAASESQLNYGDALRLVLSNRPDLARRYKETMR